MAQYRASNGLDCYYCGEAPCQCDDEEAIDPELGSLADTLDGRDFTPPPPALLRPMWIRRMRARLTRFRETGVVDWMGAA